MIGAKREIKRLTQDNESLRRLLGKSLEQLVEKTKENQKLKEENQKLKELYENQMQ